MAGNAAKKIMKWQAANAANNRPETIAGAQIAWGKIDDEKGRGVFALRDFKKGEVVEISPVVPVSKESINQNGDAPDGYLLDWDGNYENEEYCMPLGYVMMYNHSAEPNIGLEQDFDEYTMTVSALRDIKRGEELCWNYNCKIWWEDDEEEEA